MVYRGETGSSSEVADCGNVADTGVGIGGEIRRLRSPFLRGDTRDEMMEDVRDCDLGDCGSSLVVISDGLCFSTFRS